jgi:hypothetical protein
MSYTGKVVETQVVGSVASHHLLNRSEKEEIWLQIGQAWMILLWKRRLTAVIKQRSIKKKNHMKRSIYAISEMPLTISANMVIKSDEYGVSIQAFSYLAANQWIRPVSFGVGFAPVLQLSTHLCSDSHVLLTVHVQATKVEFGWRKKNGVHSFDMQKREPGVYDKATQYIGFHRDSKNSTTYFIMLRYHVVRTFGLVWSDVQVELDPVSRRLATPISQLMLNAKIGSVANLASGKRGRRKSGGMKTLRGW